MGNGTLDVDPIVMFRPASYVNFANGHVNYNSSNPYKFQSMSKYTKLIRGAANTFHIEKDILFSNVSIKVENNSVLTVADGTEVAYQDCKLILPGVKFSISGSRYNTYTVLLDGSEEVFLEEGIFPLYLVVRNSGNVIRGNGDVSGLITFADGGSELYLNLDGQILNNIALNGGKVILARDIELAHDNIFTGSGIVDLSNYSLVLGKKDLTWTSTIYWDGNVGDIEFNSKLSLSSTWTFSGECTLYGNDKILELEPTAQIIVERGSTLNFKDMRIQGLCGTNIKCLDDAGKITFDNVSCRQSADYVFDTGSFDISNELSLEGGHKFTYKSGQQSNILSKATLFLDKNSTFSYDAGIMSKELIVFQDDTSILYLNGASLHTTLTGIQLTKGTMFVEGSCYLSSETITVSWGDLAGNILINEGVAFGNNSSAQDFTCKILNGSKLELTAGCFIYKNILSSSFDMENNTSMLQIDGRNILKLYQNLDVGNGKIYFVGNCIIYRAGGKRILGSIDSVGRITYGSL